MADVVVLTMSEFGRAVAENGSRGTDHGHGNAMMVIGGGVRGGKVYGRWPGLALEQRYEGRDLAVTTDFRDVFARGRDAATSAWPTAAVFPGCNGPRGESPGCSPRRTGHRVIGRLEIGSDRRSAPIRNPDDPMPYPDVPIPMTPMTLRDIPISARPRARRLGPRGTATSTACRRPPTRAASGCVRTPRPTSRRTSRGWQIERGAVGICCAKLGEAEVFADAGIDDIRFPTRSTRRTPIACVALLDRDAHLVHRRPPEVARGWSEAMQRAGREVDVLVKVDVGFHRCGIDPDAPTPLRWSSRSRRCPACGFRGLLSHAGHALSRGVGSGHARRSPRPKPRR